MTVNDIFLRVSADNETTTTTGTPEGAPEEGAPQGDPISTLLITFLPMIAIFYFLIIRPQRKRDKQAKTMMESIKVGDEVLCNSGIYGKIVRIKDDTFFIESTPEKTRLQIARWAVREVTKSLESDE